MSRKAEGGSRRFLTGMVLGFVLGVLVAKTLDRGPWQAWERAVGRVGGAAERAGLVEKVIDGDTIVIKGGERVRIIGVDAPEREEPFYEEAKEFQEKAVLGSRVQIEACREEPRDSYGRTLAFVRAEEMDVGRQLVQHGLARTLFVGPCGRAVGQAYRKTEREAFLAARGIWSLQDPRRVSHEEAGRYVGLLMTVTGKVSGVHGGPKAFHLNFGSDYRKDFTVVILRKNLARLIKEGLVPVAEYEGRIVDVTGILEEYNGPEIVIESADQLVLSPQTP